MAVRPSSGYTYACGLTCCRNHRNMVSRSEAKTIKWRKRRCNRIDRRAYDDDTEKRLEDAR